MLNLNLSFYTSINCVYKPAVVVQSHSDQQQQNKEKTRVVDYDRTTISPVVSEVWLELTVECFIGPDCSRSCGGDFLGLLYNGHLVPWHSRLSVKFTGVDYCLLSRPLLSQRQTDNGRNLWNDFWEQRKCKRCCSSGNLIRYLGFDVDKIWNGGNSFKHIPQWGPDRSRGTYS